MSTLKSLNKKASVYLVSFKSGVIKLIACKTQAFMDEPTHAFFDFRSHYGKLDFAPEDQHKLDTGKDDACVGPAIQLARAANVHGVQAPASVRENQAKMQEEEKKKEEKRKRMTSPKSQSPKADPPP